MDKIESLIHDLQKANQRLEEAATLPSDNPINRDATIQRFEFTFELSWKLMQALLQYQGFNTSIGIKNIIRETARQLNLINDPQIWIQYLDNRNRVAHSYNETTANQIYHQAQNFPLTVKSFINKVQDFLR